MADLGIADAVGELGKRRDGFAHLLARRHLRMGGCGADDERAVLPADALQLSDAAEIDEHGRLGKPLLHRRDQRVAARESRCVRRGERLRGGGDG